MSLLLNTKIRVVLLGLLIVALPLCLEGREDTPRPTAQSLSHRADMIDSLFNAAAYDSIMVLIPSLLDEARVTGDSTVLARLLINRGRVEMMRSTVEAGKTLELARQIAEAARDTTRLMDALGFQGLAMTWQGRHREGIEFQQIRLALAQRTGDRVSEAWARTGIGYVYLRTGELELARSEYTAAVDLFHAENLPREELTPLIGLGRVLNALQEIDAARECYQRVWRTAREIGDLVQESNAVNNLGGLEYQYGDMSVAAHYFERAYDLSRKMNNSRGTIIPAVNIALVRSLLGQYGDAASILLEAVHTCEEGNYEDLIGMVLCNLAHVRLMQKRMHESAGLYRRTLSLGGRLTKKAHNDAVYGLAKVLVAMDSVEVATSVLTTSLDNEPLPEFETLMGILLAKCLRLLIRTDEALAQAHASEQLANHYTSHEALFLAAFELSACFDGVGNEAEAYTWYRRGIEALEKFRSSTKEHEWREAHGRIRTVVDGGHIVLTYPPDRRRSERVEALFDIVQRFKARTLAERITEPRKRLEQASELAALPPVGLAELKADILRPDEVFLDFAVGNEITYLFAITRDSCRVVTLPGRDSDLPAKIDFHLEALGHPPTGARRETGGSSSRDRLIREETATIVGGREIDLMGASLFQLLLGQVGDLVYPASRILIAPDSYLSSVPFCAIVLPAPGGGGLILEKKEIHQVPSATVLKWLRSAAGHEQRQPAACRLLALVPRRSDELKGITREVAALRDNISGVETFRGKPAKSIFDDVGGACEVIHVAAHVIVNNEKPWHSGILLEPAPDAWSAKARVRGTAPKDIAATGIIGTESTDPPIPPSDPYLRAGEIASGSARAHLAVLSGCESARGRAGGGEGVLGLTSAFLSAGVSSVVATLWPVDDAVTADLMDAFYTGLAEGRTVASALRGAQLRIRADEKTRHPFYWAGFIVMGDGDVGVLIERPQRTSMMFMIAIGCFILLVAAVLARVGYKTRRAL